MFTGIIEGLGLIDRVMPFGEHERRFIIRPLFSIGNLQDGASISVNGVCLSVESHTEQVFTAYASGETLSRTNLSSMASGDRVNLEQAVMAGTRLDGHIVTGHIDCLAFLLSISQAGESRILRFRFPASYAPFVISKGSVALNGISLTINNCGRDYLEVNVIPDSQSRTNMPDWKPGMQINMETDIIGKYVCHLMQPWQGTPADPDLEFLAANGFI